MLVVVALFFLLAVFGPVISAPLPAEECSSSVVLEGRTVKVTTLLSNHRCSLPHLFESLFEDDDVLTSTIGDGDAHKVCVGFLELVKVGEAGNLLEDICLQAKFTSLEEDYCQRVDQNAVDIKTLINPSSSLTLPDGYRSALEILSTLDRVNCNNICGGKKTVLCDTVVEVGKAFSVAKSPITDESSANPSRSDSGATTVNETRSHSTDVDVNSDDLPRTENGTGSSKTQFNSTIETTSKQLPQIADYHNSEKRFSSQDKNVRSQSSPSGQGQQLGTEQTNLHQQVIDPNQKLSSGYSTRSNPSIPGQPNFYPAGRNLNVPGQPKWYPTGQNPNIPGQPNLYLTGRNPNIPGQPKWYPTGRNPNIPRQPDSYGMGRNPNNPGQPNFYPAGRNPNIPGQPNIYLTGRNPNVPGQPESYETGRNPNFPRQPYLYSTGRNQNNRGQLLQYPAQNNQNIPREPFQYPAGRRQNFTDQHSREQDQNQGTQGASTFYPGGSSPNQNTPVGSPNQRNPLEPPGHQNQEKNYEDVVSSHFNKTHLGHFTVDPENKEPVPLDLGGEKSSTQKDKELDESGKKSESGTSSTEANDIQEGQKKQDDLQESHKKDDLQEGQKKDDLQDHKKDDLQEGQTKDDLQEGQAKGDLQEGQTKDDLQEGQTKDDLQEGQTKDGMQEGQTKNDLQEGQTKGDLQDGLKKDDLQGGQKKNDLQEGQKKDDLQEGQKKDDMPSETNSDSVSDKEKQNIGDNSEQNKEGQGGSQKNDDDTFVDVKKEQADETLTSFSEGAEANQMNNAPDDKNSADSFQNFDPFPNDESEKGNKAFQLPLPNESEKSKFHADSDTPTQPTSQKSTNPTTEEMSIDDEYHGYGTWHFVSIFLIVSVIAIVGYFFVHNRKKLRESLTAGKGRRKNNYRPLSQQ